MSTENTPSNSLFYRIYALLSAIWIFISSPFISAVSGLSAVYKRSSMMELPVSSPTIHQTGFTEDNVCAQTAGYPRISRIRRQRRAYHNESAMSPNAENAETSVSNESPPEEWAEEISESKSSPYMTSSSTMDNTTISASISLESHSVYSSPPSSLIFRTPIITITSPGEACSEGEGLDNESFSGDALDEDDVAEAPGDTEETAEPFATDTESPSLCQPSLGNLAMRRGFHGAPILTSFPVPKALCSPSSMPSWSPHSRQSSGCVPVRRPKTALLFPDTAHEDYTDIDSPADDTEYDASTPDTLMNHSNIYTSNQITDSNSEHCSMDDDAFSGAYTPTTLIMTTICENEEYDAKLSDYMRRSFSGANTSSKGRSETSTVPIERSKESRKKSSDECILPHAVDSIHDTTKNLSLLHTNPMASRSMVRRVLSGIDGDLAVFADLITQVDRQDVDKEFGDRRFSFPYYPTGHGSAHCTKTVKPNPQINDSRSEEKASPLARVVCVSSSSVSLQHQARCSSLSPADIILSDNTGELSALDLRAGSPLHDALSGFRESLANFSARIDVTPTRPTRMDTKEDAKVELGDCSAGISDSLTEPANIKASLFPARDRGGTDFPLERRLAVRSWLSMVNASVEPEATQPESLQIRHPESPQREPAAHYLIFPSGDEFTRPSGTEEDQRYPMGHKGRSGKQQPLKHCSNSRHASTRSLDSMSARARIISLEKYCESLVFSGRKPSTTELRQESALRPLMLPMCLAVRDSMGGINRCDDFISVTGVDSVSCAGPVPPPTGNRRQRTSQMLDAVLGELAEALNLPSIGNTGPDDDPDQSLSSPHHSNCDLKENQGDISTDSTISWGSAL